MRARFFFHRFSYPRCGSGRIKSRFETVTLLPPFSRSPPLINESRRSLRARSSLWSIAYKLVAHYQRRSEVVCRCRWSSIFSALINLRYIPAIKALSLSLSLRRGAANKFISKRYARACRTRNSKPYVAQRYDVGYIIHRRARYNVRPRVYQLQLPTHARPIFILFALFTFDAFIKCRLSREYNYLGDQASTERGRRKYLRAPRK